MKTRNILIIILILIILYVLFKKALARPTEEVPTAPTEEHAWWLNWLGM